MKRLGLLLAILAMFALIVPATFVDAKSFGGSRSYSSRSYSSKSYSKPSTSTSTKTTTKKTLFGGTKTKTETVTKDASGKTVSKTTNVTKTDKKGNVTSSKTKTKTAPVSKRAHKKSDTKYGKKWGKSRKYKPLGSRDYMYSRGSSIYASNWMGYMMLYLILTDEPVRYEPGMYNVEGGRYEVEDDYDVNFFPAGSKEKIEVIDYEDDGVWDERDDDALYNQDHSDDGVGIVGLFIGLFLFMFVFFLLWLFVFRKK